MSRTILIPLFLLLALAGVAHAALPPHFSYQGSLEFRGEPYTGEADFKFALVDTVTNDIYWNNDGSPFDEPYDSLRVPVHQGIFSVLIGGGDMDRIESNIVADFDETVALRMWVDIGEGFVQLSDQAISTTLLAQHAESANLAHGDFFAFGEIWSRSGGFKFPDGSVQTTAATGSSGGGGTLDDAYDFGGPGGGRTIVADAGQIIINGSGGLYVEGRATAYQGLSIGTLSALAPLHIDGNNWDLDSSYGDMTLGNGQHSLRFGMATQGLGAGSGRIRAVGGTEQLLLGAGVEDVVRVAEDGFSVSTGNFQVETDGRVSVEGSYSAGQSALRVENNSTTGYALWAENAGTTPTMLVRQSGTGDMIRGYQGTSLKFRVLDDGKVVTPAVTITGGADLAEPFLLSEALELVEPGSVLAIDPTNPGNLTLADQPYDRRVAGIASGAGGVRPGLTLSQQGVLEGGLQVALTGRVYVRASAINGAIEPGDMITTSEIPGVAMKASDPGRAYGAVVGKAMTPLDSGEGLVLVLVGLQ